MTSLDYGNSELSTLGKVSIFKWGTLFFFCHVWKKGSLLQQFDCLKNAEWFYSATQRVTCFLQEMEDRSGLTLSRPESKCAWSTCRKSVALFLLLPDFLWKYNLCLEGKKCKSENIFFPVLLSRLFLAFWKCDFSVYFSFRADVNDVIHSSLLMVHWVPLTTTLQ